MFCELVLLSPSGTSERRFRPQPRALLTASRLRWPISNVFAHRCGVCPWIQTPPAVHDAAVTRDGLSSLWCVLHLAVAEGPILSVGINQADPDILLAHLCLRVNFVGNLLKELLLHLG